jgi:hypothetical protein
MEPIRSDRNERNKEEFRNPSRQVTCKKANASTKALLKQ